MRDGRRSLPSAASPTHLVCKRAATLELFSSNLGNGTPVSAVIQQ